MSARSLSRAKRINREVPEAASLVSDGKVSLADAESLVGQDAHVRRLAVELVENGDCKRLRPALALVMARTGDVGGGNGH